MKRIILVLTIFAGAGSISTSEGFPIPGREGIDQFGAESNPTGDPIGGGKGYRRIVQRRDYAVATAEDLINALRQAKNGETIFVSDRAEVNLSGRAPLKIPAGVTLAGGRGESGSPGPLVFTTSLDADGMFIIDGPSVRITGIRLQGPDPERRATAYEAPNSIGILVRQSRIEVDNCEISGWSHAGIYLAAGSSGYIHHNYIHHNQRSGLGYGVCLVQAEALVEANLFDFNRHHVAGTGSPGTSYEARYNIILEHTNGYSFDMHGGRDRKDGTDVAGTRIDIHHNTFGITDSWGVLINGIPEQFALIHHNWFQQANPEKAFGQYYGLKGQVYGYLNVFGPDKKLRGAAIRVASSASISSADRVIGTAAPAEVFGLLSCDGKSFSVALPATAKESGVSEGRIEIADAQIIQVTDEELAASREEGLIAHYQFERTPTGVRVASGSSRKSACAVYGQASCEDTDLGQALRFHGTDGYVDCGVEPGSNIGNAASISVLFKPDAVQGGIIGMSAGEKWPDQRLVLTFSDYENHSQFLACLADGRGYQRTYNLEVPKPGAWTLVTLTYDGSWFRIYRDGLKASESKETVHPLVSGVSLLIGRCQGLGNEYFKGLMKSIRVYSRALTEEEIQFDYREAFPK